MKVVFFIGFFLLPIFGFGQQDLEVLFRKADDVCLKNFDSCNYWCEVGLTHSENVKSELYLAAFQCIKGKSFYFAGQYDSCAFYLSKAASALELLPTHEKLGFTYNELGKLYRRTNKLDESLSFYQKALEVYEELNDLKGIGMIYNERAVVYEKQNRFDDALKGYEKSLSIAEGRKDLTGMGYALNFMANIFSKQRNVAKANLNYEKALQMHTDAHDSFALAWCYLDYASHLKSIEKYPLSLTYLNRAILIANQINLPEIIKSAYHELASIDSAKGNFAGAFRNLKLEQAMSDSLFNEEKHKTIEEINTKYQTAQKEKLIETQKRNLFQKNVSLVALLVGFIFAIVLFWFIMQRRKSEHQKKIQLEIIKQQDLSMKAVIEAEEKERQRIAADLHDGIGQLLSAAKMNLNAVEDDILEAKKPIMEKAIALIHESAKEVRSVSHNIMPNALLKAGLGTAVKDFIDKLDQNKLQVHVHAVGMKEKIESNIEIVVYRIIQESVNNVIKHAKATRLDISLIHEDHSLDIIIEDNGIGFNVQKAKEKDGIGLANIQTRIDYLRGTLEIDSQPEKGCVITIHIPIEAKK